MSKSSHHQILSYLKTHPKTKIIIGSEELEGLNYLNVGEELSNRIVPLLNDKRISLKSKEIIEDLFNEHIVTINPFGKCLAISNLGILFEPELKFDFLNLIKNFSTDNSLFIQWSGDIDTGHLYFLSRNNGKKVNIKNLSHIVI